MPVPSTARPNECLTQDFEFLIRMSDSQKLPEDINLVAGEHCVLMLHGLCSSPLELSRLAKDLHSQGFSVVVPNIPNYSFGTECGQWQGWIDHVQKLLWALRKKYKTVSVVGLSMGATLAMVLAQREPVSGLVLLSTALAYDGWAIPWYSFLLNFSKWVPYASRYRYAEAEPFGVKNPEMRAMIKRALAKDHISEMGADALSFGYVAQGKLLIKEAKANVSAIDCPTLFIHAADDETVHMRNAEWIYKHMKSEDKEFIYLGDSYHMITVDNERETVNQESIRFLKKTVNQALDQPFFDVATIQSAELRRALRQR
jgi:carboxylesterase